MHLFQRSSAAPSSKGYEKHELPLNKNAGQSLSQQEKKTRVLAPTQLRKILVLFAVLSSSLIMFMAGSGRSLATSIKPVIALGIVLSCVTCFLSRRRTRITQIRRCLQSSLLSRKRILIVFLATFAMASWWLFNLLSVALGYKPPHVNLASYTPEKDHMLTVFLIDGLRGDIFEEELEAGRVPNIQALARKGCRVSHVVAPFPTITGYAYWPLLTGIEATRSGHLGTRYFNREIDVGNWHNYYGPAGKLYNSHFEPTTRTLFEALPEEKWSVATNSFLKRGATLQWNTGTEQSFSKAMHIWWLPQLLCKIPFWGERIAPTFAQHEMYYMDRIIHIVQKGPSLVWGVFSGVDNAAHAVGVGKEYTDTLHAVDTAIGKYVEAVQSYNSGMRHTFAIVSDHGEASVDIKGGGNLDLCDAFRPIGLRAWRGDSKNWSGKFDDKLDVFGADKDVLVGISGDTSATVYVKHPTGGWKERTYESDLLQYSTGPSGSGANLIETVLNFSGVQLVGWSRSNGVVAVQTAIMDDMAPNSKQVSAVGVITYDATGMISYRVERENNEKKRCPFGYNEKLADGVMRGASTWLEETADTPYPYALVRLVQYFTAPGLAPDMVVTAHDGYDFGKDWEYYLGNFAGGHGGIHKDHMRVPAIFSGAGVSQRGTVTKTATLEDVGASLHYMLQKSSTSRSTSFTPAPLDFLKDHRNDIIATAYLFNKTSHATQDLLRGKPLSCLL